MYQNIIKILVCQENNNFQLFKVSSFYILYSLKYNKITKIASLKIIKFRSQI